MAICRRSTSTRTPYSTRRALSGGRSRVSNSHFVGVEGSSPRSTLNTERSCINLQELNSRVLQWSPYLCPVDFKMCSASSVSGSLFNSAGVTGGKNATTVGRRLTTTVSFAAGHWRGSCEQSNDNQGDDSDGLFRCLQLYAEHRRNTLPYTLRLTL
jgi:hypothetical protein